MAERNFLKLRPDLDSKGVSGPTCFFGRGLPGKFRTLAIAQRSRFLGFGNGAVGRVGAGCPQFSEPLGPGLGGVSAELPLGEGPAIGAELSPLGGERCSALAASRCWPPWLVHRR